MVRQIHPWCNSNVANIFYLFVLSGCLSELLIFTAQFSGQCWIGVQVSKRVGTSLTSREIPWLLFELPGHNSNTISECSLTLSGQPRLSCCKKTTVRRQIKARSSVFYLHAQLRFLHNWLTQSSTPSVSLYYMWLMCSNSFHRLYF